MGHKYHLTRVSLNKKTGGIPVSTTSKSSCPARCSLQGNGCYSESGPIYIHWSKLDTTGLTLSEFCKEIRALPKGQLWRHNQAGDLPGDGTLLDAEALQQIVVANRGRRGFGFTHYDPNDAHNADAIRSANASGFTLNMSAETLDEVDSFVELGVGPVVTLLGSDQRKPVVTPRGNFVAVCPATFANVTCATCGICAHPTRKAVIGFPAHGSAKRKAAKVFYMKEVVTWAN